MLTDEGSEGLAGDHRLRGWPGSAQILKAPALGAQAKFADHRHSREAPFRDQQSALCARCFSIWATFSNLSRSGHRDYHSHSLV